VSAYVFILVEDIERFIVLEAVEGLMEQRKVISDLRHQLQKSEALVAFLRLGSFQRSTEASTGSSIPVNVYTTLGGSDTGSTI
jgi:hypothetical protein